MSEEEMCSSGGGGIGFFGLLQIAFIVLKLTHAIDWNWWLVLLPALTAVALAIVGIALLVLKEKGR